MKNLFALPLLLALILVGCSDSLTDADSAATPEVATSVNGGVAVYDVAIRNISGQGQYFTPPVAVTHNANADLYTVGSAASFGIKEIAENGNLDPLVNALSNNPDIGDLVVAVAGTPPPLAPGQTVKFRITAPAGIDYFSFASMLICTNDGFTGLDAVKLPKYVGQDVGFGLRGYDAGTEINTEDFADIVPPCQGLVGISSDDAGTGTSNPALAENGVITLHPNVQGGDDLLTSVHGWNEPVGKVRIRRIQ